ncbi:SDR family oxidoreductase [Dyella jejuensis]|uniref:SDR family oxidoreductase n=1 Tax=Dyella jejuensis TaxID=1432009 RepID=A0ABW8JK09_9GAMM
MSERVLIAGCGDLGYRVARLLLARGEKVYALRRHPPRQDDGSLCWLKADLGRPETLGALPAGITQLVYLPAPDARAQEAYRTVFVDGLRHLVGALDSRYLQRVLFVSSSAVYGDHASEWVDEATLPAPRDFNGRILLEAEQWLAGQPFRSVVLRLAGLYGPGRLQLIERLRAGTAVVPRKAVHWTNRIHVDDAAAAIVHLLDLAQPQALYLGADDTPLPIDVLYDYLAEASGAPQVAEGQAPASIGSKRLSNARLRASGFRLRWPDSRAGYLDLLRSSSN